MMASYFGISLLAAITVILFSIAEAQSCTMGFLSTVSECTSISCGTRHLGNSKVTRIIPDMMFTCTGTVVKWRAAGIYINNGRSVNAMLVIWRERSDIPGTYDKVAIVELGTCGSVQPTPVNNVYECTLPESMRVSVQPGDIVGIEIARDNTYRFRLYFDNTNGGPTNYVFNGQFSTVTLSQSASTSQDQPQISLTVEMAVQTTESSTTTQLSTTTIASPTELTKAADTTPGEAQTTTIVMEYSTPLTTDPVEMAVQTTERSTATQFLTTTIASTTDLTTAADTTPAGEVDSSTTAHLSMASTTDLTTAADNTQTLSNSEVATTTGAVSGVPTTSEAVSDQQISSGANIGLVVGLVVIALIAVTLTVTVVVLVIILRGNKRNSLSTSVPTDTNQAYDVTNQRDMDEICNEEDVYSYPEVVLNNEVQTKSNEAYATTICTEENVAYYSTNMFVQENEAYVTNVVTETNEAPRNIIVNENHHVYESGSEHEYY